MTYIDTSSFIKLLLVEPESEEIEKAIGALDVVVVTSLTRLEAKVQARGFVAGGRLDSRAGRRFEADMRQLLNEAPFCIYQLEGSIFETAIRQQEASIVHCRSLDRLHLAAMEELGVRRLMTHDGRQAEAARELGYEVVTPGA